MKIAIIVNVALLLILVIGAWSGYKKGLIMGIGGIIAIIISLYGANLLATTFSHEVIPALKPFAGGFIEGRINADNGVSDAMGWGDSHFSINDLLEAEPGRVEEYCTKCYENIGIDSEAAAVMAREAIVYADEVGIDITDAVIHVACARASFVGCFLVAFAMIVIILTVIGNLPNLSYKLPNYDLLNDIGGTVLGLVTAVFYCCIIVWALKFMGILFGNGALTAAGLAKFFARNNFVTRFLGI